MIKQRTMAGLFMAGVMAGTGVWLWPSTPPQPEPEPEPEGNLTRYLREVSERAAALGRQGKPVPYVTGTEATAQGPATGRREHTPVHAAPVPQPVDTGLEAGVRGNLRGLFSGNTGHAQFAHQSIYDLLKGQPDETREAIVQAQLGRGWEAFAGAVAEAAARYETELRQSIDPVLSQGQGYAHLSHAQACQLRADVQTLIGIVNHRKDLYLRENAGLSGQEVLQREKYLKNLYDNIDLISPQDRRCGGLQLVRPS